MTDFHFANPDYLFLLLALPLLQALVSYFHKNARERLLRFVSATNLDALLKGKGASGIDWKKLFFWLGTLLLILALARPQANPQVEEMEGASLDIYVLLDVSRSMDAEDVPPSRLARAKHAVESLMQLLSGDRVGLVAFAGTAVLISPLTSDYEVIHTFMQNVDTSLIQNQGTDIPHALSVAEEAMRRGAERTGDTGPRSNVFVVLSDGEDHGDENWSIVDQIRKEGGTVFTIAFGTASGASIPVRNAQGEIAGYKRDRAGNQVKTAVETKALEEIAKRGGGQFYVSTPDEGEVRDILNRMQNMDRSGATLMRARVYEEYFMPFLAAGLAFLLFSFLSIPRLSFKNPLRKSLLLLALFPSAAKASPLSWLWDGEKRAYQDSQGLAAEGKTEEAVNRLKPLLAEHPDSPELNYNVGTYLLGAKKDEEGREQLKRLTETENPLRSEALFNIAGSYAQGGKKEEARATYADLIQSLREKSRSPQEEKLLEMAKQNLSRLATNPPPQPQNNQQQNQQNQNQQQNQDQKNQDQKNQDQKNQQGQNSSQSNEKKPQDKKQENKDGKGGENDKDQKDPQDKDQNKENGGQKENQDQQDQGDQQKQNQQSRGMRTGSKEFKEKGDMAEEDAKRLLEALKQRESGLQRKFLKQKAKGDNSEDESNKDW
jgi:Ca-activated chloride channel family protein